MGNGAHTAGMECLVAYGDIKSCKCLRKLEARIASLGYVGCQGKLCDAVAVIAFVVRQVYDYLKYPCKFISASVFFLLLSFPLNPDMLGTFGLLTL